MSDAEGRFGARGLPARPVHVLLPDPITDASWTYRPVGNLQLEPGATAEATLELIAGVLVEGTVLDAETGRGIPGATLHGPNAAARTDDRGRFRLRLPPGPATVTLDFVRGYQMRNRGITWELELREGEPVELPPVELRKVRLPRP